MREMRYIPISIAIIIFSLGLASGAHAQELVPDTLHTMKAKVIEVLKREQANLPGSNVQTVLQSLSVQILDGSEAGKIVQVDDDHLGLTAGQVFYLTHTTNSAGGTDYYSVSEPYRLPAIGILAALFVGIVLLLGGKQGLRGLLALAVSLALILFLLLPGILHGYSPILVSVGVSSLIIVMGSYITHGFNRTTSIAVLGMIVTVVLTGLLAYFAVPFAHLTGFSTEESVYLNINTQGTLSLSGLLVGAILIGTLGVLYDAAIGQAISVEELSAAGTHLSRREVYRRALRIGREHIGALVNTLAIAYVGAALPLLLLFYGFGTDTILTGINREIFATEIVRAIVGSIGLVLAVPITTAIAAQLLVGRPASPGTRHTHRH